MGVLPQPAEWSNDLQTKFGGRFNNLEQRIALIETARSLVATSAQLDDNSRNAFASSVTFTESLVDNVAVPKGYSQCYVLLYVSAGQTGTTGTFVSVQPYIAGAPGPGISNGSPGAGPVSVTSFFAQRLTDLTNDGSGTIRLAAWCAGSATVTAGSVNTHLSASLLFLR